MVEDDPKIDVTIPRVGAGVTPTPFAIRETHRLYRLQAARVVAVVAADTEEARAGGAS
jgi:hypothetical protein